MICITFPVVRGKLLLCSIGLVIMLDVEFEFPLSKSSVYFQSQLQTEIAVIVII